MSFSLSPFIKLTNKKKIWLCNTKLTSREIEPFFLLLIPEDSETDKHILVHLWPPSGCVWTNLHFIQWKHERMEETSKTIYKLCVNRLEVNKCAFTFSSEIRQIQCTRTEFWCVQCPRPAGPSALDKHQIQSSALDLSYFTSKSKCKFINLIHTRQKNKIICSWLWKIINKMALKCH